MSSRQSDDDGLIIDLLLGRCDARQRGEIEERLAGEPGLRSLKQDVQNALSAMELLPEVEPSGDLVSRTLQRVASTRLTNALIAREQKGHRWSFSTFSMREAGTIAAAVLLLAALFVPSIRQARRRMLISECASNMGQIGSAVSAYAASNDEYLPIALESPAQWMQVSGRKPVSNSAALFKLLQSSHASPRVFQCPARGIESFAVVEGMTDFPSERHVGYSYQHPLTPEGPIRRSRYSPAEQEKMVILSDSTPVFPGGCFDRSKVSALASDNHGGTGQNVLRLNNSVAWASNPNVGVDGNNIFLAEGVFDYRGDEMPTSRTDSFLLPAYTSN